MLHSAFDGSFTDSDWEHCLGGMHVVVLDGDEPIAHAAVVQRRLLHHGRALRSGYVEGVAVRSDRRGEGHAATVMDAVESICAAAYDIAALGATDRALGFYTSRGWLPWRGTCSALTPEGIVSTPVDAESLFVLPGDSGIDVTGEITCDFRPGELW
ncbi:MAG: GNAT family N-acetyltransferase [Solirubrobacterales bacterium]|nr:GNAT family N-acetyltransferase [Solirubrobacterales bacterium]